VHPRQQSYISNQPQMQHSQQQQPSSHYPRQQPKPTTQDLQQQHYGGSMQMPKNKRPIGGPYLPQQHSFSSSEEDIRSTPEFEGQSFDFPNFHFLI
jgi:regulating synaptic membrane exocytosis protein 2